MTSSKILCCHRNVFTELLHSNDMEINRHTYKRVQQFFYCVYSLPRECACRCLAANGGIHFAENIPNNNRRETHTDTQSCGRELWSNRWVRLRCYDIRTKFNRDWFRYSKVNRKGESQTQTAWRSHKPILIFQRKGRRLKTMKIPSQECRWPDQVLYL